MYNTVQLALSCVQTYRVIEQVYNAPNMLDMDTDEWFNLALVCRELHHHLTRQLLPYIHSTPPWRIKLVIPTTRTPHRYKNAVRMCVSGQSLLTLMQSGFLVHNVIKTNSLQPTSSYTLEARRIHTIFHRLFDASEELIRKSDNDKPLSERQRKMHELFVRLKRERLEAVDVVKNACPLSSSRGLGGGGGGSIDETLCVVTSIFEYALDYCKTKMWPCMREFFAAWAGMVAIMDDHYAHADYEHMVDKILVADSENALFGLPFEMIDPLSQCLNNILKLHNGLFLLLRWLGRGGYDEKVAQFKTFVTLHFGSRNNKAKRGKRWRIMLRALRMFYMESFNDPNIYPLSHRLLSVNDTRDHAFHCHIDAFVTFLLNSSVAPQTTTTTSVLYIMRFIHTLELHSKEHNLKSIIIERQSYDSILYIAKFLFYKCGMDGQKVLLNVFARKGLFYRLLERANLEREFYLYDLLSKFILNEDEENESLLPMLLTPRKWWQIMTMISECTRRHTCSRGLIKRLTLSNQYYRIRESVDRLDSMQSLIYYINITIKGQKPWDLKVRSNLCNVLCSIIETRIIELAYVGYTFPTLVDNDGGGDEEEDIKIEHDKIQFLHGVSDCISIYTSNYGNKNQPCQDSILVKAIVKSVQPLLLPYLAYIKRWREEANLSDPDNDVCCSYCKKSLLLCVTRISMLVEYVGLSTLKTVSYPIRNTQNDLIAHLVRRRLIRHDYPSTSKEKLITLEEEDDIYDYFDDGDDNLLIGNWSDEEEEEEETLLQQ